METKICPKCGIPNSDDWPLNIGGEILFGGCQECWEAKSDEDWWEIVVSADKIQQRFEEV